MKRLSMLGKVLLLVFCLSFFLSAANAGSVIDNTLIVPYVETDPIIDGELDEDWTFPEVGMYVYTFGNTPEGEGGALDLSSHFRAAWNENGFYFFGRVFDDTIYVDMEAQSYYQDGWELFFDGGNEDSPYYDSNDVQWRWVYGLPVDSLGMPGGWAMAGYWAWMETDSGYDFELRISADSLEKSGIQLFPLMEGTEIGFEAQVTDNDTGARDFMTKWWSDSNYSWYDPGLFGTAVLGDDEFTLEIPEIDIPPIIDGENTSGEWDSIPEVAMTVNVNEHLPDGGHAEFSSFYRTAWNADGFYFFGRVVDDSIYTAGTNNWEQDCWNLYFDGDNSKGTSYDANDVLWRWVYGVDTLNPGWADAGAWAWAETDSGYAFELVISQDSLVNVGTPLFSLTRGTVIGFEVQVTDNDTGATDPHDCVSKWWSNSNLSWQLPQIFGTAVLGKIEDGISELAAKDIALSIPAVVNSSAIISYTIPVRSSVNVDLYNLAGQKAAALVNATQSAGTYSVELDASGLANGVYLLRINACGTNTAKKVLLIK